MLEQFLDWVFIDNTTHKVYNMNAQCHYICLPIQVSIHQSRHKILMTYNVRGPYYICAVNLILAHISPVKQKQLITVDSLSKTKASLTSRTFIKHFYRVYISQNNWVWSVCKTSMWATIHI